MWVSLLSCGEKSPVLLAFNITLYVIWMCILCIYTLYIFVYLAPLSRVHKTSSQIEPLTMTGVRLAGTLSDKGIQTALKLGTQKSDSDGLDPS